MKSRSLFSQAIMFMVALLIMDTAFSQNSPNASNGRAPFPVPPPNPRRPPNRPPANPPPPNPGNNQNNNNNDGAANTKGTSLFIAGTDAEGKEVAEYNDGVAAQKEPAPQEVLLPATAHLSVMMTPVAYNQAGTFAYAALGGVANAPYSKESDFAFNAGLGFGNSRKAVGVMAFVTVNDVSQFSNLSYNLILNRDLGRSTFMSVGALHQFANSELTDADGSYFVALTHLSKAEVAPGVQRFSYTIGYGNGRFLDKSRMDISTGKGEKGTGVFGSISYSVIPAIAVGAEWTGLNLAVSTSLNPAPGWPSLFVGVTDLTRNSGDRPSFMAGIAKGFYFGKK